MANPKKFLTSLNLVKNELQNARIQNLASAPSSPLAGQVYYDTSLGKFGIYNGTTWDYMGTSTATGDFSSNTATSVDGEAVVFSGTAGKTGKRYTSTGIVKATSGVLSSATSGTDYSAGTSALGTGILKSTTTTGALTIAVAGDFPTLNQSTTGSAATLTTPRAIYGNNFDGSAALAQIIASTYGGTGNGFTKFSGPASTEKTFTLPNASATVLTDNAAVTVAQGGTGRATGTTAYGLVAVGTTATGVQQTISPGTSGQFLKSAGAASLGAFANIAESDVTNLVTDLGLKAPLASPTFTGTVTVPTPTGATDAATKGYVDNSVQGLSWKQAVRVASTANITIASALVNASTIDGVTVATGDRVLLKNQTTGSENGIYVVVASGAASRSTDADTSAEVDSMTVYVEEGTANADTVWTLTTNNPTLNTTSLVYAQVNGGTVPVADTSTQGKVELATTAETEAKTDTARAVTPSGLATFTRTYNATIGNGSATSIAVTHSLGNQWVLAQLVDATSFEQVEATVTLTSSSVTTFDFEVAPTTNQYRVIIVG